MNQSIALRRKLLYLVILVLLIVPLYLLGQPPGGGGAAGGGVLAQMRDDLEISESDLGEISPASETMKLMSLGMRGPAAALLWRKQHEYKVRHEWDRLKATLNQIGLLQPHFDKVWEHQAHNLAYNVSTEFDDYRQRYEMVREGTEYLTKGVRRNRKAPRLIWYTGWFYGSKLGMSDEKTQFRKLFADDTVLHDHLIEEGIAVDSPEARGPNNKPDNWLVGRLWLNHGYDLVDGGVQIRRQTPINFFESGPKWSIKHAEAIEKEGILDQSAQDAWLNASADWRRLGERSIPTTAPFTIKLGRLDELLRQRSEKAERFRQLTEAGFNEAIAKGGTLTPIVQEAFDTPPEERTESQKSMVSENLASLTNDYDRIARSSAPEVRLEAIRLAGELDDMNERLIKTTGYRNQINYEYWETLAAAEQEERTVRARRLTFEAEEANRDAELQKAIDLYEESFAVWAEIFDDYPILVIDDSAEDLFDSVRRYMIATDSDELPEDFPLRTFVDLMGQYGDVNPEMYERVRNEQAEKMAQRKSELAAKEEALIAGQPDPTPPAQGEGKSEEPKIEAPEPKTEAPEPEMKAEPEMKVVPETKVVPEPKVEPEPEAPVADAEPSPKAQPASQPDPKAPTDTEAEPPTADPLPKLSEIEEVPAD